MTQHKHRVTMQEAPSNKQPKVELQEQFAPPKAKVQAKAKAKPKAKAKAKPRSDKQLKAKTPKPKTSKAKPAVAQVTKVAGDHQKISTLRAKPCPSVS